MPAPAIAATGPSCIACAAPIEPLARTCKSCGAFQVQLAPGTPDVAIPAPPSSRGAPRPAEAPASVPPPPMHRARPSLDDFDAAPIATMREPFEVPAPPPARPSFAWSVVQLLNDGSERALGVFDDGLDLGRRALAGLGDDPFVSPKHARLEATPDAVVVRDLGSLNGTFVRVAAHAPTPLQSGDVLLLGAQVLAFELLDGAVPPGAVRDETNVFGCPAKARLARLVEVTCDGGPRSTYVIGLETVLIGREAADIVCADDPHLSRRHAELRVHGGVATLVDLGSSNGTYVRLRGEALLESGAQLRIGQQRIRIDRVENRGGA